MFSHEWAHIKFSEFFALVLSDFLLNRITAYFKPYWMLPTHRIHS